MEEPLIKSLLNTFARDFAKSESRKTYGRGGQVCPVVPEASSAQYVMNNVFTNFEVDGLPKDVHESARLSSFGVVPDVVKSYAEIFGLASIRYHAVGCREVVLVSWLDIIAHMKEHSKIDTMRFLPSKASTAFKLMDENHAKLFISSGKPLYYGTLTVGNILYIPAGWLVVEKTTPQSDLLGFVLRGLCKDDEKAIDFFNA
eukprot:9488867-Pyramimonas_sp.AAC.1